MLDYSRRLSQIESQLGKQITGGDWLLGELESSQINLDELRRLFREWFGGYQRGNIPLERILGRIRSEWPAAFALYLTLEGLNSYEDGEYWPALRNVLGLKSRQDEDDCGQLFLDTLTKFRLPTFENEHRGHKYVTPILLHGGIPTNSLDSFFNFLQRESGRHLILVDAATLLAQWQAISDAYPAYIAKPVKRFLSLGGAVAEDFLGRVLELMAVEEKTEAAALELPERIVQHYWKWREQHAQHYAAHPRTRLASPSLFVAPFGEGVLLHLPTQQFPKRINSLRWHVQTGEQGTKRINTERQRQANGYRYIVPESIPVGVAEKYQVVLEADGESLRTWSLAGLGQSPLLVFDPINAYHGVALDVDERSQPGRRWLVYPQSYQVKAGASASQRIEILPGLQGGWADFHLETWEVRPGILRVVDAQGVEKGRLAINQESGRRQPYWMSGQPATFDVGQHNFPFYMGAPPQLALTFRSEARSDAAWQRWRLTLRAEESSQPEGIRTHRLTDIESALSWDNDQTVRVDLADQRLLGPTPAGVFEVQVRGPLRSYVLGLRMTPPLRVEGLERVYISAESGPAMLEITCDTDTSIESAAAEEEVTAQLRGTANRERAYVITVAPHLWQIRLWLQHTTGARLLLEIPLRRVRWRLLTRAEDESAIWRNERLRLSLKEISAEHILQVYAPIAANGARLYAGWRLVNSLSEVVLENRLERERILQQADIPLAALRMAWRENLDTYQLQLLIVGESGEDIQAVDALYLTPTLEPGAVLSEWLASNGRQAQFSVNGWRRTAAPDCASYGNMRNRPVIAGCSYGRKTHRGLSGQALTCLCRMAPLPRRFGKEM